MTELLEGSQSEHQASIVKSKHVSNGNAAHGPEGEDENGQDGFTPPDGGARAWLVMIGAFVCNGILFGVINSYGVLFKKIHDDLQSRNDTDASSKVALVGSLAMGTTFFVSPISGMLADNLGLRLTTFLGGATATTGMFLSSFCTSNMMAMSFTYGIMYGFGGSLAYTPSLAILGHYFQKNLGVVNGVVTAGSSLFSVIMPFIIDESLKKLGLEWTLRLLALIASSLMICAVLFKPLLTRPARRTKLSDIFDRNVLTNRKYIIWAAIIAGALFGYFVPFVYMLKFVEDDFPKGSDGKLALLCIALASGAGRLFFGYVADRPRVNRIYLQQMALFSIGLLTMFLPLAANKMYALIIITLGMGLFDGCFISMLGPVAIDICGKEGAAQAIGFLLGLCAIPLTLGPYVSGLIYDSQHSLTLPFLLAGIPPVFGSAAMFLILCVRLSHGCQMEQEKRPPEEQALKANKHTGPFDSQEEEGPL